MAILFTLKWNQKQSREKCKKRGVKGFGEILCKYEQGGSWRLFRNMDELLMKNKQCTYKGCTP